MTAKYLFTHCFDIFDFGDDIKFYDQRSGRLEIGGRVHDFTVDNLLYRGEQKARSRISTIYPDTRYSQRHAAFPSVFHSRYSDPLFCIDIHLEKDAKERIEPAYSYLSDSREEYVVRDIYLNFDNLSDIERNPDENDVLRFLHILFNQKMASEDKLNLLRGMSTDGD